VDTSLPIDRGILLWPPRIASHLPTWTAKASAALERRPKVDSIAFALSRLTATRDVLDRKLDALRLYLDGGAVLELSDADFSPACWPQV
jgi:hypothetical protein